MVLLRYARRLSAGRVLVLALIFALLLARGFSHGGQSARYIHVYTASDATLRLRAQQYFGFHVLPAGLKITTLAIRPAAAVLTVKGSDPSVQVILTEVQKGASKATRRLYVSPQQARAGAISTADRTVILSGRRVLFQRSVFNLSSVSTAAEHCVLYFGLASPNRRMSVIVTTATPQAEDKTAAAVFALLAQILQADPNLESLS